MSLHVHRAERADRLADALAAFLRVPPPDPFVPEVVSVPTRGVERWLAQSLSAHLGVGPLGGDGVCAGIEFPFPGRLLQGALAQATGVDPTDDPWEPERSMWSLLAVVDDCLHEEFMTPLRRHLGDPARGRFPAVRRIARLLNRYADNRPEMVCAWLAGEDPADGDRAWQAELLRRLRGRIGVPSPAERLRPACDLIREQPELIDLPDRLSFFGLTRMSRSHLALVAALSARRDIRLFLLHPSPGLWDAVVREVPREGARTRRLDPTRGLPGNRLLASWGRDARELQLALMESSTFTSEHHPLPDSAETLLGRLQADVRNDRMPPGEPRHPEQEVRPRLLPGDRSLEIHDCHGRARQVEVLREAILHALAEDPTLEPRDVVVMCPDIETYAPLISATFSASGQAGVDLRVRLADRALRQSNPVLGALGALLDLAGSRMTASGVLDFADREPVRRRFALDDDALARVRGWVMTSGIRWGLSEEHRRVYEMQDFPQGTWRAGLGRIIAGVALAESFTGPPLLGGTLPLDDVDTGSIDLVGRFAELLDRIDAALEAFNGCRSLPQWATALAQAADNLFATGPRDVWQREEMVRVLADLQADGAGSPAELELSEVRALLTDRLAGRPTRANFRTGHLTVCTLVPMRSVPHRVVCIVGLDDGEFPRPRRRDGDDVTAQDPLVGEFDSRSEDRQMLLDALMAAQERLIITYAGRDERRNRERPPAVPVSELLDVIDRTVAAGVVPVREQVLRRHPLQPFDPRNFRSEGLRAPAPWSFDPLALAGARACARPRSPAPPFLPVALEPLPGEIVELADLIAFLERPARAFLRQRLGLVLGRDEDQVMDTLPVDLDNLGRYGVGERMLQGLTAGRSPAECFAAEGVRGELPPGRLASSILREVYAAAQPLADAAGPWLEQDAISYDVAVPLGPRLLSGTVAGVRGDVLLEVSYSRMSPNRRLRSWARLLALTAAHPHRPFTSLSIGRAGGRYASVTQAIIPPLGPDEETRQEAASAELLRLVDLLDRGRCEPLPISCRAAAAWAEAARSADDASARARREWTTDPYKDDFQKEDGDAEHVLLYGRSAPLERLLEFAPGPGEAGPGWDSSEATRFGRLARRLWDPLLTRERLENR